ncbi:MAG: radical SAM protein [Lachnospiraceae bacterium]|nr:radical SAM protein [Lachnospiraceae bacterium]
MKDYSGYSELKIFHHIDRIEGLLEGERVAPIYVRIKPTNVCNQRCYYCGYADNNVIEDRNVDNRESIDWGLLKNTLYELHEMGTKAVTFSGGGDPLCYSSIKETLSLVAELGFDYSLITNGQALKDDKIELLKGAKWVRVSLDASNANTYKRIRNVDSYSQVIRNIESFAEKKNQDCTLGINCVISKENHKEIYDICRLVKEIGVDNIKLSPVIEKKNNEEYHQEISFSVQEQLQRAIDNLETDKFKIVDGYTNNISSIKTYCRPYKRCLIQEFFAVIGADAKVYRCHETAYRKQGILGDLNKESFRQIWYKPETIESIKKYDVNENCTHKCAFNNRNIILNSFLNIDKNHVNFI